jgi:hypothetical protein
VQVVCDQQMQALEGPGFQEGQAAGAEHTTTTTKSPLI